MTKLKQTEPEVVEPINFTEEIKKDKELMSVHKNEKKAKKSGKVRKSKKSK